jgi:hypothetical protein
MTLSLLFRAFRADLISSYNMLLIPIDLRLEDPVVCGNLNVNDASTSGEPRVKEN